MYPSTSSQPLPSSAQGEQHPPAELNPSVQMAAPLIHDFQQTRAATDIIFEALKPADIEAALQLIRRHKPNREEITSALDLGCGEGAMLPLFKELASANSTLFLHLNDTNPDRINTYAERIAQTPNVLLGDQIIGKMEEVELPRADLVLASHSLYYNVSFWQRPSEPEAPQQPLLESLSARLNPNGLLCVILLANELTRIRADNPNREFVANLQEFEDMAYPIIQEACGNPGQRTNASLFLLALDEYNRTHHDHQLEYEVSEPIVVPIKLGDINFDQTDEHGYYPQSPSVKNYLNFYTRDCYDDPTGKRQMRPERQKEVLNFIRENCRSEEGEYMITHVDQATAVRRTPRYR